MNFVKRLALLAVVGTAGVGIVGADQWDKKTIITTEEAMQLPNTMLQPGTYVIKLLDLGSNRHTVQFFDKDEQRLITTILAIPNERVRPTGKSVFAFWEVPAGQPKALRAWFYPGDNFGQEFAYPKNEAVTIAANNGGAKVPINDEKTTETAPQAPAAVEATPTPTPAPVAAVEPAPAPAPVEVAAAPRQAPPPAPAVGEPVRPPTPTVDTTSDAQRQSPSPAPESLPKTASNLALFGLIGLASIGAALAVNFVYRRG